MKLLNIEKISGITALSLARNVNPAFVDMTIRSTGLTPM